MVWFQAVLENTKRLNLCESFWYDSILNMLQIYSYLVKKQRFLSAIFAINFQSLVLSF